MNIINKLIDGLENQIYLFHGGHYPNYKIAKLFDKMREWSKLHESVYDHEESNSFLRSIGDSDIEKYIKFENEVMKND